MLVLRACSQKPLGIVLYRVSPVSLIYFFVLSLAESCFLFALTRQKLPPFCQQGYAKMQGLAGSERLRRHAVAAGLLEDFAAADFSGDKLPDGDQLLKEHVVPVRPLQHLVNAKDEL